MEAIFIKVNEMQKDSRKVLLSLPSAPPPFFHPIFPHLTPCAPWKAEIFVFKPTRSCLFPGEIARNRPRLWNCYRVAYKNRLCSRDKSPHFAAVCLSVCEKEESWLKKPAGY